MSHEDIPFLRDLHGDLMDAFDRRSKRIPTPVSPNGSLRARPWMRQRMWIVTSSAIIVSVMVGAAVLIQAEGARPKLSPRVAAGLFPTDSGSASANTLLVTGMSLPWKPGEIVGRPGVSSVSLSVAVSQAGFGVQLPSVAVGGETGPASVLLTQQPDISSTAQGVALVYDKVEIDEEPAPPRVDPSALWSAMASQNAAVGGSTGTIDGQPALFASGLSDYDGHPYPAGVEWVENGILNRVRGYLPLSDLITIAQSLEPYVSPASSGR